MATVQLTNVLRKGQVVAAGGWNAVFGNDHPLNLEIGIGGGEFILTLAQRFPRENFVGIDIAGHFLRKAAKKAMREGIGNIRFLTTDAKGLLYETVPHESLQAVYVNFPDPWPKRGHEKRRHFDEKFVRLVEDRLAPEGYLYLATDVEEYAELAYESLSQSEVLANAYSSPWLNERGWQGLETRYEEKWKEMGKTLFYLAFRKARGMKASRYDIAYTNFKPFDLGTLSLEEVRDRMREPVHIDGHYVVKPLGPKLVDGTVRVKVLLVEKGLALRDYLHGVVAPAPDDSTRLIFDVENTGDFVYTAAKERVLARYFDGIMVG